MTNPFEINQEEFTPGRILLGTVKVEMGRLFLFGAKQGLHEMVSFIPGLGNGAYEVYGEVKDVPGYGYRITKVEIECITNDEIRYYEREFSDCVMEVAI